MPPSLLPCPEEDGAKDDQGDDEDDEQFANHGYGTDARCLSSSNQLRTTTDSRVDPPIARQLAFSNGLQSALLIRLASGSGQRFHWSSLVTLWPRP